MNSEIERIVLNVLEQMDSCCLDNSDERELVASVVSRELIVQSMNQLADVLNGSIEVDNNGQAIIYTGVNLKGENMAY